MLSVEVEIEQLLYREARYLDSGELRAWLDLFSDDCRYVIPIRETLQTSREGIRGDDEIAVAHVDEDKQGLELRVRRIETGRAHAEEPASRTRRMVGNVELLETRDDELVVVSNLLLFLGRRDHAEFLFSGQRHDRLRRTGDAWQITYRRVLLDHTVLPRPLTQLL